MRTLILIWVCTLSALGQIRVNVGGPQYTDSNGNVWAADYGCTSQSTYSRSNAIQGTTDPTLYRTGRTSSTVVNCTYTVASPSFYLVTLLFAETDPTVTVTSQSGGKPRIMNVYINNQLYWAQLNVLASSARNTAYSITSPYIGVSAEQISVNVTQIAYQAMLSGIDIEPVPTIVNQSPFISVATFGVLPSNSDNTSAINAANAAVASLGGGILWWPCGTYRADGNIVFVNYGGTASGTTPYQNPVTWQGCGNSVFGVSPTLQTVGTFLDLRSTTAPAKIDTRGGGMLVVRGMTIGDLGTDTSPMIQATNTSLMLDASVTISGTHTAGTGRSNNGIVLGGTGTTNGNGPNNYFQGYNTWIDGTTFDKINTAIICQVGCNGPMKWHIILSDTSASVDTSSITGCTNAAVVVCTLADSFAGGGVVVGSTLNLTISGFTGINWSTVNGARNCTIVTTNTCSIAFNSTGWGAVTGTPVFNSGAAIIIDGNSIASAGIVVDTPLLELSRYAYGIKLANANNITINYPQFFDQTSAIIAPVRIESTSNYNQLNLGTGQALSGLQFVDLTATFGKYCGLSQVSSQLQGGINCHVEPEFHTNTVVYQTSNGLGPYICIADGTVCQTHQMTSGGGQVVDRIRFYTGGKITPNGYVGGSSSENLILDDFGAGTFELICPNSTASCRFVSAGDIRMVTAAGGTMFGGDGILNWTYNSATGAFTIPAAGAYVVGAATGVTSPTCSSFTKGICTAP